MASQLALLARVPSNTLSRTALWRVQLQEEFWLLSTLIGSSILAYLCTQTLIDMCCSAYALLHRIADTHGSPVFNWRGPAYTLSHLTSAQSASMSGTVKTLLCVQVGGRHSWQHCSPGPSHFANCLMKKRVEHQQTLHIASCNLTASRMPVSRLFWLLRPSQVDKSFELSMFCFFRLELWCRTIQCRTVHMRQVNTVDLSQLRLCRQLFSRRQPTFQRSTTLLSVAIQFWIPLWASSTRQGNTLWEL